MTSKSFSCALASQPLPTMLWFELGLVLLGNSEGLAPVMCGCYFGSLVLIFLKVFCLFKNLNIYFVSLNWWITKLVKQEYESDF
jgi:hypothetical protein